MKKIVSVGVLVFLLLFSVAFAAVKKTTPEFLLDKFKMKLGDVQSISGIFNGNYDLDGFESSNEDVVEILPNGNLKAKATGSTTLTYTYTATGGKEIVLKCHIEVTRYDATFDTVGGGVTKADIFITLDLGEYKVVLKSAAAAIPALPELKREGYVFEGWYTEPTFVNKVKDNQRFNKDVTFYPKWSTVAEHAAATALTSALYDDINGHWAQVAIDAVSYKGLFQGVAERTFAPEQTMTRAMAVSVIGRLEEIDATKYSAKFADVNNEAYYAGHLAWAVENKIVKDIKDNNFRPNDPITREEVANYIANYMTYRKIDVERFLSIPYKDVEDLSATSKEALDLLYNTGVMQGTSGLTFDPQSAVTRAQMAQIFYNLYNFSMKYKG